ncbi:PEP-CTERM sorting domain-containing protein [Coleofasciculus chthonoplastes]|uniref:PEP-CTERM sorting domain-containing protein n=1 Tax=Coleofasciculus chthonoplastes TaxID=64178 RepID=UPI0032F226D4
MIFSQLASNNRFLLASSFVLTAIIGAMPASAASINGLFTTGVDNDSNALPLGFQDSHYTVVETGNKNSFTISKSLPVQIPNNSTSLWIWENSNAKPIGVTRTFRTTFNLTGLNPNTASISGLWATDNLGSDILINGLSTGEKSTGYRRPSSFNINSGFVAGVNTLDFVVQETRGGDGAFRVLEISGTAEPVPEPLTIVGSATALGVGSLLKRQSSKNKNKS